MYGINYIPVILLGIALSIPVVLLRLLEPYNCQIHQKENCTKQKKHSGRGGL